MDAKADAESGKGGELQTGNYYTILTADGLAPLITAVNNHMKAGFFPVGGVVPIPAIVSTSIIAQGAGPARVTMYFGQAMVYVNEKA